MNLGSSFVNMKPHELIASGICSLDAVIGGGLAVGSLILLSEDSAGVYADKFLKIFLAQGILKQDEILMVSCNTSPVNFMKKLPQQSSSNANPGKFSTDPLHIAWRYENNPSSSSFDTNKSHSDNFIFKDTLSDEIVKSTNLHYWPTKENPPTFTNLLDCIYKTLTASNNLNELTSKKTDKSVLRIGIHCLGSFFWKQPQSELPAFLYKLRALVHHSRTVALITFPKHLIKEAHIISRCEQLSDTVIELESFGANTNPLYSDLDGLIRFNKLCTLNSLCPLISDPNDWAFKFSQKKLIIEKLRLPPESAVSTQREQESSAICGQTSKAMDF